MDTIIRKTATAMVNTVTGQVKKDSDFTGHHESIYDKIEREIMNSDISEAEKNKKLSGLLKARGQKINLMLVGSTGSGKSSTINSLFNTSVAKVGVGVDPETRDIECYQLENLVIWDSPGLGDGKDADSRYSSEIISKLSETDKNGVPVIDLVLVVVDAASKDMGTTYNLINNVLIPSLTPDNKNRIIIAVNQADMAMKGNHWNYEKNCPDDILADLLNRKCKSIQNRIQESTGYEFKVMYYCAGYTDDDGTQRPAYNLTKLLYNVVMSLPAEKRLAIAENLNNDDDMWKYDDEEEDYVNAMAESFGEVFLDTLSSYAEKGTICGGTALGIPGAVIGTVIGGAVGAIAGIFKGIFGR